MSGRQVFSGIVIIVVIWLAAACTYTIPQSHLGILFQYGKIIRMNMPPGLHFKIPILQSTRVFDGRIRSMDNPPQKFLTTNKRNVKVDYFVKWHITNTKKYYQATGGHSSVLESRLSSIVDSGLRDQLSSLTIHEAVSTQRTHIMQALDKQASKKINGLGIKIINIRIKQIELPDVVHKSVFKRMRAEREKVAKKVRAEGQGASKRIRAKADQKRTVILAKAFNKSLTIKGNGDAKATGIYADAYDKDREFYNFVRSLRVYRNGWSSKQDMLVLEPDTQLFKYFKSSVKSKQ